MTFHSLAQATPLTAATPPHLSNVAPLEIFPLATAHVGDVVTIIGVKGGNTSHKRLMAMGMADGTTLKVVQHNHTELLVSVDHRRFSLDIALACRILVSRADFS